MVTLPFPHRPHPAPATPDGPEQVITSLGIGLVILTRRWIRRRQRYRIVRERGLDHRGRSTSVRHPPQDRTTVSPGSRELDEGIVDPDEMETTPIDASPGPDESLSPPPPPPPLRPPPPPPPMVASTVASVDDGGPSHRSLARIPRALERSSESTTERSSDETITLDDIRPRSGTSTKLDQGKKSLRRKPRVEKRTVTADVRDGDEDTKRLVDPAST